MKLLFIILLLSESAFGLTTTAIAAITASNASIIASNAAASARRRRERECKEEFMSKSCPPVRQEVLNYNGKFYEEPKLYIKLEFK